MFSDEEEGIPIRLVYLYFIAAAVKITERCFPITYAVSVQPKVKFHLSTFINTYSDPSPDILANRPYVYV